MKTPSLTPAIVLRSWSFGESDKIVSFFTELHGKLTGIAKGAKRSRRRFVNTLEPFSLVNLRFQERPNSSLAFVHSCDLVRPFRGLAGSLEKIAHGFYLLETTDALTSEREENRLLFDHLREGLIFLEEQGPSGAFLAFFELKLLKLSGYQPMLESCRRCGKSAEENGRWHFSLRDGGILCEPCSTLRKETLPLSFEAIQVLRSLQQESGAPERFSFSTSILSESRSFLLSFIRFQVNKDLKSAVFLDRFSSV